MSPRKSPIDRSAGLLVLHVMGEIEADREVARRLLEWQAAMGVDCAVADEATDWLAGDALVPGAALAILPPVRAAAAAVSSTPPAPSRSPPPSPLRSPQPSPASPPPRVFPTASPDAAQSSARDIAAAAASLEALRDALVRFDGCALKATAKNLCFYRGAPSSRLMLIGEAPGREEDLEGKPFVGSAGRLLDKMLQAAGLTEADVHITNIVYWRPPGNRTPTPQEALVCRPFLERQVELVDPDVIVALGGAAAKHLLAVEEGIMRLRGKWRELEIGGRKRRVMATLHPAYLLRTPAQKRLAWRDMLAIMAR